MSTKKWTDAQREVIESTAPQMMVVAGPGSGKTSVTVARLNRLIGTGLDPRKIIAITFTTAGARELEQRLKNQESLVADKNPGLGFTGTIHAFCLRMLKQHGQEFGWGDRTTLIDEESARQLLETKAKTLGCFTQVADLEKIKSKGLPAVGPHFRASQLTKEQLVILAYQEDLRGAGMVDFDTILSEFIRLLGQPTFIDALRRFTHLFVDEIQDSGAQDWTIFDGIPVEHRCYVGDGDQSIYGFRGGDPMIMLTRARRAPDKVIKLEANFRSDRRICEGAQRLIQHNRSRIDKRTIPVSDSPGRISLIHGAANEGEEIAMVARQVKDLLVRTKPCEIAVLARTNKVAQGFKQTFRACGIPVAESKAPRLPRDLPFTRSALELMSNPSNDTLAEFYLTRLHEKEGASILSAKKMAHEEAVAARAEGKSVNAHWSHFTRQPLPNVCTWLATLKVSRESQMLVAERIKLLPAGADLADLLLSLGRRDEPEEMTSGVFIGTAHSSKGREWDCVFIVGFEDEIWRCKGGDLTEDERRLAFVAVTRARHELILSWADNRITPWGAAQKSTPSRFIREIG